MDVSASEFLEEVTHCIASPLVWSISGVVVSPLCPDAYLLTYAPVKNGCTAVSSLTPYAAAACRRWFLDASFLLSPLMEQVKAIVLFCLHMNTHVCVHFISM